MSDRPTSTLGQTGILTTSQEQKQKTKLILAKLAKLLEVPKEGMEDYIKKEMDENPYLEANKDNDGDDDQGSSTSDEMAASESEPLDNSVDADPEDDSYSDTSDGGSGINTVSDAGGWNVSHEVSLMDSLLQQAGEHDLTEREEYIVKYLIGSLDDHGFLTTNLLLIEDDLYTKHNIRTNDRELKRMLSVLQTFDPAGIGARNVSESLQLQARRRQKGERLDMLLRLFDGRHYDDFLKSHWAVLQRQLHLTDADMHWIRREVKNYNPYPGRNENTSTPSRTISPDFEVVFDEDHHMQLYVYDGRIPRLSIAQEALDGSKLSDEETKRWYSQHVEAAQVLKQALRKRHETLERTMRAIIKLQYPFFVDGDSASLKPMILEDVANIVGIDLSSISRTVKDRYVQTPHGCYPLKWFFSRAVKRRPTQEQAGNGAQVLDNPDEGGSVLHMKEILKEIIDNEDKSNPYTDDQLTTELNRRGFAVARRTVAKYRSAMGYLGKTKRIE